MNHPSFATPLTSILLTVLLGACAVEGADPTVGLSESANTAALSSRCTESAVEVRCPHNTDTINLRDVHWQVPLGTAPAGGWPTVVMFQGSLFSASLTWQASKGLPFGAYYQTQVVKRLLDHGFAVLAPEARGEGLTFWDTNNPLFANAWTASGDHRLMLAIFDAIDAGKFGPLRGTRMYATGISSGGYMTSRMGIAYPGRFAALGVQSGSYATCAGPLCVIPTLDPSHPPTLLLHGSSDGTVPLSTAERYRDRLNAAGIENRLIVHPGDGHEWISEAPDAVLAWFTGHP
ncbi:prolyl oligopeptidase family serine peptidase [Pendulispora rubella]|uniref:Prolyl oligopeptidase family serine peptidase n=1 Tax=Pendulispora rubella TaxID=2741070 RepID=A0ABZ2L2Q4_9BACT